jgi:hypothetical protein
VSEILVRPLIAFARAVDIPPEPFTCALRSPGMAQYFFDLLDGTTQRDLVGAELNNDAAAKQEALMRALNGTSHQIAHYNGSKEIAVRNDQGEQIFKTPIMRLKPRQS